MTRGLPSVVPLLLIALAVKLTSRGPVLYVQDRVGLDRRLRRFFGDNHRRADDLGGRPFRIYKFRTMTVDAEHRSGAVWAAQDDPRVTPLGRVLRRFSLDELPQLVNVLRGEMSLVGPRPLPLDEDRHVHDWARRRLAVKPGITGLWQVLGREEIPFGEMVKLDYLYVSEWSLLGDLKLFFRTAPAVLRRRDAC